jgi:transcription elongation factor GreB
VPNYVTPRGLELLREERARLNAERTTLTAESKGADGTAESERKRRLTVVSTQLQQLAERLALAKLVTPRGDEGDPIRFGAHVVVEMADGEERRFQIVGVDEADAAEGRIAFTSPMARAVNGKKAGDAATLETPQGEEALTIRSVSYNEAH